ncbi:MAG: glycosyl transferase group 1, partial [Acidobacteria bacterium]|nr:glycosyl transferase group 1 [Acidobacteriota bacterium]
MRLLIDGRPLVGHRTGIGVHVAEIAKRLDFDTPPTIATHTQIDDLSGLGNCAFRVDHAPNGILWQQFVLPSIDGDVLWGPHGTLPARGKTPAVITLHDFTSITMPGRHRLKTILSFNLFIGRSIERAARIAAVSRATAEEAVRGFGVSRAKIELVPNGVDEYFSPSPRRDEGDYILFVGTLEPRKGLGDLLETYASLPAPRPRLVLCGSEGWLSKMQPIDGVERTGYVDRARLRELYRGARLFVYPSHFEGFGIPPLEAMACGAPVITTRTGAIPEYAEG